MFCSNCGRELKDGVKFCPSCGAPVGTAQKLREAASQAIDSAEKEVGSAIDEVQDTLRGEDRRASYAQENGAQPAGGGAGNNGSVPAAAQPGGSYYSGNAGQTIVRLKDDRGILSYILLNIITCGIYGYYFIYKMARDVNIACDGDGENTAGIGMFILLSIVTCGFYAYYWYYKLGNRLNANAGRYGLNFQENGTTVLLWCVIGLLLCGIGPFIAMYILIKNSNLICGAYNRKNGLA